MSATALPFLAPQALHALYLNSLDLAESRGLINAVEKERLRSVIQDDTGTPAIHAYYPVLSRSDGRPVHWTGGLILRPEMPPAGDIFLFTVLGQFERFATESALRTALEQQLENPQGNSELLRFCPVDARYLLTRTGRLKLATRRIPAPVLVNVSQAIKDFIRGCHEQTLTTLLGMPTLRSVLDFQLNLVVKREFGWTPTHVHQVQLRSTRVGANPVREGDVITSSLSVAALDFYLQGGFPEHYQREYLGLSSLVATVSSEEIDQRFIRVMGTLCDDLAGHMQEALAFAWKSLPVPRFGRHDVCAVRMADFFYQQTVQARQDGRITWAQFSQLQRVPVGGPLSGDLQAAQLAVFDPYRGVVRLNGMFCLFLVRQNAPVFLFTGAQGLQMFETRAHLKTAILAPLRTPDLYEHIARHAALEDHELLAGMLELRLSVENIDTNVFDVCVHSIQKKQASDFGFLLQQFRAGRISLAALDHALDVRGLVDRDLLALSTPERWSSRFVPHGQELTLAPRSSGGQADLLSLKLPKIQAQHHLLLRPQPTARTVAGARLQSLLAASGHAQLDVQRLLVQVFEQAPHPAAVPVRSMALVDALMERVTGYRPLPLNPELIQVVQKSLRDDELKPVKSLAGTKLLTMLDQASSSFVQQLEHHQWAFFYAPYTSSSPEAAVDRLGTLRMMTLRAELRLARLENHLLDTDRAVLGTVLGYPLSSQRPALNQFVPDVFGVIVSFNGVVSSMEVTHCLLFTQRGGLESANAGRAVFWSPTRGYEGFASIDNCRVQLEARLMDKALRHDLLAHIKAAEQARVVTYLDGTQDWKPAGQNGWFYFERYDQNFTRQSQDRIINNVLADARFVCSLAARIPLSAQSFENSLHSSLLSARADEALARVIEMARLQLFRASLPGWLKSADAVQQKAYADVLQSYQRSAEAGQSYLHDIPHLAVYSNALLTARLDLDFPTAGLDPEQIEVVIDTYLAAPVPVGSTPSFLPAATTHSVQSLTQFALNGLHRINEGVMFVRRQNGDALPVALNALYVRRLVRELDLGKHYQDLLKAKLAPGNEGVTLRQAQFAEQLAVQVREQALREKLQNPDFDTAWRYISHVIDMPDGVARESLNSEYIIVRPLALIAEPDVDPDRVRGVYLIGPVEAQAGPQILWVTYSQHFTFKVYANDAALLVDLRVNTLLQAEILLRIAPYARKVYDHGGFTEPHLARYADASLNWLLLKAAPPTLALNPIAGNLFTELYKDNYEGLLEMAAAQTETTAQADWESFKVVMSLIVSSALMFLPARLSIPLVVWQTLDGLRQGVEAARKGEWGESVAEFATILALIASDRSVPHLPVERPPPLELPAAVQVKAAVRLTAQQRAGLEPFQAHEVALLNLREEALTHVYKHPRTGLLYVPLAGCLYRVQAWRERWRIYIGEASEGPLVKFNDRHLWELDPHELLLGGSPMLSAAAALADRITHEIQAAGMASIQRRFPDKALMIRDAHAQAVTYLQRCQSALRRLNDASAEHAGHRELIKTFFDVDTLEPHLLNRLNQSIEPMLTQFLHPDLSPLTSSKYVVCRSRFNDKAVAWVHRWDSHNRLFLSERFFNTLFDTPEALSQPYLKPTDPPFAVNDHYRASFMLHEVSHQVLSTEDINYLNPGFPYDDLLDETSAFGNRLQSFNQIIQDSHSPYVLPEHLFQQFDLDTYTWADIPSSPGKAKVKEITGVQTLAEARPIFGNDPAKRIELMLANADTVVLLITRLGRVQPVVPEVSGPV